MNFDKCIQVCNPQNTNIESRYSIISSAQMVPLCLFPISPQPHGSKDKLSVFDSITTESKQASRKWADCTAMEAHKRSRTRVIEAHKRPKMPKI